MSVIKGGASAESWDSIYRDEESPGWNVGTVTPVLQELLPKLTERLEHDRKRKLFVPGCGFGHDAAWLSKQGFIVEASDFSQLAVGQAKSNYGSCDNLSINQADVFSETGVYDVVFEHTFFCAIPIELREQWVEKCLGLLKPNGYYFGVFHKVNLETPDGPPHSVNDEEIKTLFGKKFEFIRYEYSKHSLSSRMGVEKEFIFKKL
tara:strand:- start:445 stop:1059 length:615 start_codon:yes stop_codon:yes gene_type:complete